MSGVDDLLGEMARLTIEHVGRPEGPHDLSMSALTRHDLVVLCDAVIAFRARALAAEQRAEAAEAERDRMRAALDACVERLIQLSAYSYDDSEPWERAVAAARAGQPATSDAERIAAPLVCSTCNDTHRITLGDREVPCTRCPVPCETCRSRPAGAGPGAYCAGTPCGCPCHRAGAWRKP